MNNLKSGGTLFLAYEGRMGRANGPAGYMVAHKILVSAPVPLELNGPLNWV